MITTDDKWLVVLTSGALGSLLSIIFGGWQWYLKYKADRKESDDRHQKDDIAYYRKMWRDDEDEIDHLRAQIRDLNDLLTEKGNEKNDK